jgi:hypothetical protein
MRPVALILLAAGLLAGCATTPSPSPALIPSPALTPSPVPTITPAPSPTSGALVTDHVGRFSITHPASWTLTSGPEAIAGRSVPLFYLSNIALTVPSCPTPNPSTHEFTGCPAPVDRLPDDGVLVTVSPNLGLPAQLPPMVSVGAADDGCRAIGGTQQVFSVVGAIVVTGCLRGPDVSTSTAELQVAIASIGGAF